MACHRSRAELATRLAIVAQATFLAAACGGDSSPPVDEASTADTSVDENSMVDAIPDNTTVGDETKTDASEERSTDGNLSSDGRPLDGSIASDAGDSGAPNDAPSARDVSDASDASDARNIADASDASDARNALDAGDASDASNALDAGDASDASNASDAGDASDASDADAGLIRDPRLGNAARFAVFAGSTVTNAFGTLTTITGDLGTYPSTTAIGTTPPVLVGAYQLGNPVAQAAAADIVTAYNGLTPASMPGCTSLANPDLGGLTLLPGIYCFSTSAQLTGPLVLDAANNPNAEWFFQIGSTLTTGPLGAAPASVTVIRGGNPCNAYWQVGSSATLGTATQFSGNIVALASVTLVTGTTLVGRALAANGAVTMDTNTVSIASCP